MDLEILEKTIDLLRSKGVKEFSNLKDGYVLTFSDEWYDADAATEYEIPVLTDSPAE